MIKLCAGVVVALCLAPGLPPAVLAAEQHRVAIAYLAPSEPAQRKIYETLKRERILENLAELLSPFELPRALTLELKGCDGVENAWYDDERHSVTVCYEYLARLLHDAPRETTAAGVTPEDAVLGPTAEVFLHEFAHALFDLFRIPVLGREEDAADMVAAYTLLQFGPEFARSAIGGIAYMYARQANDKPLNAETAAEVHPFTQQRFYNLLCLAYGADPKTFTDVVDKGYLPKERAENCVYEYRQVDYAVRTLLWPHMDPARRDAVRARLANKFASPEKRRPEH